MENKNAKLWAISVMKIDGKVLKKILGSETADDWMFTNRIYSRFGGMF